MSVIGVIGAGTMGRGVVSVFAANGYEVILLDLSQEVLAEAQKGIKNMLRFRQVAKRTGEDGKPESDEIVLSRIEFTTDHEKLERSDFIVENINENYELKKQIYLQIDKICRKDVIFAVNTSCISITKIAALTSRPEQIIGTHFMNPVGMIHAVEVIKGFHTSEETILKTKQILESVGKESIVVQDSPGFVTNRISHLLMNEAAFIVEEQVATPEAVDAIFRKCYGHKMGPLETADLIGIDTVVDSLDVLFESFKDPKFRCCPTLRKMSDAGLKGRKSGKGFYNY